MNIFYFTFKKLSKIGISHLGPTSSFNQGLEPTKHYTTLHAMMLLPIQHRVKNYLMQIIASKSNNENNEKFRIEKFIFK